MLTKEQQIFAKALVEQCPDRERWLVVMRYGLNQLLDTPDFLMQLVLAEAQRYHEERVKEYPLATLPEALSSVMKELGLYVTRSAEA